MELHARNIFIFLLLLVCFGDARGQEHDLARSADAVPYTIHAEKPLHSFYTAGHQRRDLKTGIVRAAYRISDYQEAAASPGQTARNYLANNYRALGLSATLDELVEDQIATTPVSTHITYRQVFEGIPVHQAGVKVNLNREGLPAMMINHTRPIEGLDEAMLTPAIPASMVTQLLGGFAAVQDWKTTDPSLVIAPVSPARLAWFVVGWPQGQYGEWEFLMDAQTGDLLEAREVSTHPLSATTRFTPSALQTVTNQVTTGPFTGQGFVFDPDPLSTANVTYGSPYLDNEDADNPLLQSQYLTVDLLDISQSNEGLYVLTGPHVAISGNNPNGGSNYEPPALQDPAGFKVDRSSATFEATMAYYHIDKSQRYIQSLDLGRPILDLPFPTNPHGLGEQDNSKFYPNLNFIAFGDGGVDDGEDATVIWHEYGHAILEASAPGLLLGNEGQALHEGWADYWAASYARGLVEAGLISRQDWEFLFKWDSGDSFIWQGREVTFDGKYPEDTRCDDGTFSCNIYADGALWATVLMEIFDVLGRQTTDRLSLHSHAYLMSPVTFTDAAEALLQADVDLYSGANTQIMIPILQRRGLLDLSSRAPVVAHDAIPSTEQLGGRVMASLEAIGLAAPVESVTILYDYGQAPLDTLQAEPIANNQFQFEIPLLSSPGSVRYAIIAADSIGLTTRFPAGNETFTFSFGTDTTPPTASHTPLSTVELANWPPILLVAATDEIGIDTVLVDFTITDAEGLETFAGTFGLSLEGPRYRGTFPIAANLVLPGSTVNYTILVRDRAAEANQILLPETGSYAFSVRSENGILRQYDFESETSDLTLSNIWERGVPSLGTEVTPSGRQALITSAGAPYPDSPGLSSVTLPSINLNAFETPYLVFWHRYDTEYGDPIPTTTPAQYALWDGGNIKISIDGGINWEVLLPPTERGYSGIIADGTENPLATQPAYGGFSYGWQQEILPLPSANTMIRFDFGTDAGNDQPAESYAGWIIDDVTIMDRRPVDAQSPEPDIVPAAITVRDPGQELPLLLFSADDETGVSFVEVTFDLYSMSSESGRFRLSMDPASLQLFSGSFPGVLSETLTTGDSLTYRFNYADMHGNTGTYPSLDQAPLRIEYRLREEINLLDQTSPTGLWKPSGAGWLINEPGDNAADVPPVSSLVMGPVDVPSNVDQIDLVLLYQSTLGNELGGNVKISEDQASTWNVLVPVTPYPSTFMGPEHRMADEPVLGRNTQGTIQEVVFDLSAKAGQQLWFRVDLGALRAPNDRELWKIEDMDLKYSTLNAVDGGFDIPRELALHANYPDPFSNQTQLSFTIAESGPVSLEVYDLLGRRVGILVDTDLQAGTHSVTFTARNLSSGLYIALLTTMQGERFERMILAR